MARPRKPRWPPLPRRPHGSGSLQRLPDGTLRARLPRRVDPKRSAREFRPDQLAEAEAWLDAHGRDGPGAAISTLTDWYGWWWLTSVKPIRPETTARLYFGALAMLAPIGHKRVADLKPTDFQTVVAGLTGRLSPASLAVRVSIWRSCLEGAVDAELIGRNPVRNLNLPDAVHRTERRGWTVKEARALWAAIRGHRFEAIFALVLGAGLRVGEILGLAWKDVDLVGRRIWIGGQYTGGIWRDAPKGNNPHWVGLPKPVALILIAHHDRQESGKLLVFSSSHPRTPRSAGGKARQAAYAKEGRAESPWSYATVRRDFLALAEEVGLIDRRQHAGRHGLASHLLESGIPLPVIAEMLGHADASVTAGTYSHAGEAGHEQARRAVERLLSTTPEGPAE